jgi:dienelactone hydrolase
MGHIVNFQRPDGTELHGYLAEPAGKSKAPAIVVIQDAACPYDLAIKTTVAALPICKAAGAF